MTVLFVAFSPATDVSADIDCDLRRAPNNTLASARPLGVDEICIVTRGARVLDLFSKLCDLLSLVNRNKRP